MTRFFLAAFAIVAAGCGSAGSTGHGAGDPSFGGGGGSGGSGGGAESGGVVGDGGSGGQGGAGILTAGAWDDNDNFDFYLGYLAASEADSAMVAAGLPAVPRADRMSIAIVDGDGVPYGGADVTITDGNGVSFRTISGADGRVLFFPSWYGATGALTVTATAAGVTATATATSGDASATVQLAGVHAAAPGAIDVALVIDTTGSMGDELSYVTAELEAITSAVQSTFPGVDQRWALVVYRDEGQGDEYDVRSFPFTNDAAAMRQTLSEQSAGGGGDYPEIPDRGLATAAQLSWRGGNVARLAFLIADAPCHPGRQQKFLDAVAQLRGLGVHIYGVGASGVDEVAEYQFRGASELSGGRYLFLTDDSGVGGPHKEPTLPCYLVTKLNQQIVRMIAMELSGTHIDPAPGDIIRTGGDPTDGRCTLDGGVVVSAY